jgi:DNA-binding PadR family transcriptional regulator
MQRGNERKTFMGFPLPEQNYSRLPHAFIDCLPMIDSMAEMKVVIYLLRHTWGFSEYGKPKKITTDEFMKGRKKRDGSRMDAGTGMSKGSVITGLEKAVEHGFVLVEKDETDKARIEKHYCLNMADVQDLDIDVQNSDSSGTKVRQRSEKDTKEINSKKVKEGATKPAAPRANDFPSNVLYREVTERYPSKANWHDVLKFIDGVSQRLGRQPVKEDLLPFYSAWCGMGWNNNSINWLEYAVKGTMPGKQNGSAPSGMSVAQSWLAKKEQEAQNVRA